MKDFFEKEKKFWNQIGDIAERKELEQIFGDYIVVDNVLAMYFLFEHLELNENSLNFKYSDIEISIRYEEDYISRNRLGGSAILDTLISEFKQQEEFKVAFKIWGRDIKINELFNE